MFSEQEFIKIMNTQSGLRAVKYMKDETGFSLAACKAFLDKCKNEGKDKIGTISWFKCDDDLPPTTNKTELGHYSDHVLITDGINVDRREFVRTLKEIPIGWMGNNIIGFVPTHWAYINLPE